MEAQQVNSKRQMMIFIGIAIGLPYVLGIFMGLGYSAGIDISVFPNAQMHYPAAAAMLAALVTRKEDRLLPKRFFIGFIALTAATLLCAIVSLIVPEAPWVMISQFAIIVGSVVSWILLLTEKKDKRIAYGLKGGRWKSTFLILLLYLILYFGRTIIGYAIDGEMQAMIEIVQNPLTWLTLASLPFNFFLVIAPFLGEEYGWRYYLQPVFQKKFGMVRGILLLGVIWGFWHLPINIFYYTSPSVGMISVAGQLVTCITLGVFYGWAYLKTDNIWSVVILHFVNNNLVPVITGNYSADVLQNQEITWGAVLFSLVINTVLFMGFLFARHYRDSAHRLPTMNERADLHGQTLADQTAAEADGKEI